MSEESLTTTSLKSLFRFPFRGPVWQNRFLVGIALSFANYFIPIVPGLVVSGYAMRVLRETAQGEEPTLPEWDNWGGLLLDGLKAWVVQLVFMLPGILVMIVGYFIFMFFSFFSSLFPFLLALPAALADEGAEVAIAIFMAIPLLIFLLTFLSMAILFIGMALGWLLYLLGIAQLPMALAHLAVHGDLGAAFRFRQWWALIRANKPGYFVAWVVVVGLFAILMATAMVMGYTFILLPLLYLVAPCVNFFILMVGAALFGQTYRESAALLEAATTDTVAE